MDAAKPREAAAAIAEAVGTLNYQTGVGSGPVALEFPADLYDVTAGLKIAADRLPQLFCQTSRWLGAAGRSRTSGRRYGRQPEWLRCRPCSGPNAGNLRGRGAQPASRLRAQRMLRAQS